MGSISTTRGDAGETSLAGGIRVSKASLRVETYGTIDELNSSLGFARSICEDAGDRGVTKRHPAGPVQDRIVARDAARESEAADRHRGGARRSPDSGSSSHRSDRGHARRLVDSRRASAPRPPTTWRAPSAGAPSASLVRLQESGDAVQPAILAYVNRLSDLLWLFGRKLEHDAGVSGSLRDVTGKAGNRFSRAW